MVTIYINGTDYDCFISAISRPVPLSLTLRSALFFLILMLSSNITTQQRDEVNKMVDEEKMREEAITCLSPIC